MMATGSRLSAYLLLGDPRWIRSSVLSYYHAVDRIVALSDSDGNGWNGAPLPIADCVGELRELDTERKIVFYERPLVRPGVHPMKLDTEARRIGLQLAGQDADWVLQLDTDEIVTSIGALIECIDLAARAGADAVDYPSRWFLGKVRVFDLGNVYLEASSNALWRVAAHYPGPVAVRPNSYLNYSRRSIGTYFRVDVRKYNSYHEYTRLHPVHKVVSTREAIMHLSWVDRPDGLWSKDYRVHGHRDDHGLSVFDRQRTFRLGHPMLAVLGTPLRAGHGHPNRLRFARLNLDATPPRFGSP